MSESYREPTRAIFVESDVRKFVGSTVRLACDCASTATCRPHSLTPTLKRSCRRTRCCCSSSST